MRILPCCVDEHDRLTSSLDNAPLENSEEEIFEKSLANLADAAELLLGSGSTEKEEDGANEACCYKQLGRSATESLLT